MLDELSCVEDRLWALDAEHASLCAAINVGRDHLGISWRLRTEEDEEIHKIYDL